MSMVEGVRFPSDLQPAEHSGVPPSRDSGWPVQATDFSSAQKASAQEVFKSWDTEYGCQSKLRCET
jgi:hypothetical protein